ncbi:MAG TPA: 30S ribosomal protein S6 [Firmicutes bacterium]|jgi:small subunit ribosomal protein S6|nr:30S ribosomal protein S6 [Bacillota bacterium]
MTYYEVTYIVSPELDEEKLSETLERYQNLVQEQGGRVLNVNKWGKRRLAYEIADRREGVYVTMQFAGNVQVTDELDRSFKLAEEVLRHLIVRISQDQVVEEQA